MTNLIHLCFALLLLTSGQVLGQNFNRPVPNLVPPYEFVQYDTTHYGYYLTAPFQLGPSITDTNLVHPKPAMILDANGYLFWYMPFYSQNLLDFKYHPDEHVFSVINYRNQHDIRFMLLNTDFQFVDSFTTTKGIDPDLHDFTITHENTYLLPGVRDSVMDLSSYQFGNVQGDTNTNVIGFVVQEFDVNHQLLFQWNSNDYIRPIQAYAQYGYSPANFDYCHGNAISEALDGDLLLSFRNLNAVYKINRATGQVVWKLGGKSSSFTFTNDIGFSGQHDVINLPNGNISLFDNANLAPNPAISRAVEYQLDTVNWVATKVWEYKYAPGFLSIAMGNHQTTDTRHHLVNYGFNFRPDPSFVLVDDDKNLLTQLSFQDSFLSYRSFLFDIPFGPLQRPAIVCSHNGSAVTLSAPDGFDRYEWSTGENSAAITVNQTGVYQVWVNQGVGMLGSEPFFLTDLNNPCSLSATQTPESFENQHIIGYYDLLGRAVAEPFQGQIYAVRYENGQARLIFWGK